MKNKGRRDFLAKIGLLSGAVVLGNRSYASELARTARFKLSPELNAVHVYCTGNMNNNGRLLRELPEVVLPENALWLSTGNFVDTQGRYEEAVTRMNQLGYQVAAIGNNEWAQGGEKLVELAKKCDFTLVRSHGKAATADWQTWIKPYQIIHLQGRSIGVVAMGPSQGLEKDLQAWGETEHWAERIRKERNCDMVVCLLPAGYSKSFVMDCVAQSRSIEVLNSAAITDLKSGNRVLKNSNKQDVILTNGCPNEVKIAKQVFNLERDGLALPQHMTQKKLQQV